MSSNDAAPPKNGHEKGWSRRLIQAIAFTTGVIGVIADYGFALLGDDHIPLMLYCMCFGVALGLDPTVWLNVFWAKK